MIACRRLGAAAALVIAITVALPGAAFAAKIPGWARPIVEGAPPVPEGVPVHESRVLYDELRETVKPDGRIETVQRYVTQALSVDAWKAGISGFAFDGTAEIKSSKAWHIKPGKRARKSWSTPVDIAIGDSFLDDFRMRAVSVDDVQKGSVALFEFKSIQTPFFMPRRVIFLEDAPLHLARYILEIPEGWSVRWDWLRREGPEPSRDGSVWTWEVADLHVPDPEPLDVNAVDLAPLLMVNLVPPESVGIGPAVLPSWPALSRWYEDLAGDRAAITPEIREQAGSLPGVRDGDLLDAVREAGRFVRDKVRYVAVELGIGGHQPRPAGDTLSNLYGDCKDKATLLRSFLAVEEIPSYPVLVNLSMHDTVSDEIPSPGSFNHMIAAIPVPGDLELPDLYRHAVADAGDLGPLLFVDTTDEWVSIGWISASLSGKRALVVAGGDGRLVTLPGRDPAAHRMERYFDVQLTAAGRIQVERSSRYYGQYAQLARIGYSRSSMDRRKGVERRLMDLWPEAILGEYEVEYETPGGAYVETASAKLKNPGGTGGGSRFSLFPGAREDLQRVPLGRRTVPVDYGYPRTIRYESSYRGFPAAAPLPESRISEGEGWSIATDFKRAEGEIHAAWTLRLEKTRFQPKEFRDLRKLWSAISRTSSAWVPLAE